MPTKKLASLDVRGKGDFRTKNTEVAKSSWKSSQRNREIGLRGTVACLGKISGDVTVNIDIKMGKSTSCAEKKEGPRRRPK